MSQFLFPVLLCEGSEESIQQVFLGCNFSRVVWYGSPLSLRTEFFDPSDVNHWLEACLQTGIDHPHVMKELTCSIVITLYVIWYVRNQVIFQGVTRMLLVPQCSRQSLSEYILHDTEQPKLSPATEFGCRIELPLFFFKLGWIASCIYQFPGQRSGEITLSNVS